MGMVGAVSPRIARRMTVRGRVQGVGYRAFVADAARRAGAAGWAENQDDGSVELHVEGEAAAVERVLEAARRGPRGSYVERADEADARPAGSDGFSTHRR
jgi:acylphosphatase